ncbi:MAG: outer membrane protein assembly factor BamA [Deltaproteobacteria bacterium]|nr:outer membrane protein assembly factor BamA [Deltaproteobacteria bacterium]
MPNTGDSLEPIHILVLPFEVHSRENLLYLQAEIAGVIQEHMEQNGAVIIKKNIIKDASWIRRSKNMNAVRQFGLKNGADYVIWGTLTRIGQKYSLDAWLMAPAMRKPPNIYSVEGSGIENLPESVKQIARDIAVVLFKYEKVEDVIIEGNNRIETEAIKRVIETEPGDVYLIKRLSEDLRRIYLTGYFDDVRIESEDGTEGKIVMFRVKEKPVIRTILITGNNPSIFEVEEIKDVLDITTGSILSIEKLRNSVETIEDMYKDKNFHNVNVSYTISELDKNQADVEFEIEEGNQLKIREIIFEGNKEFPSKKLKKRMSTDEKGFFSWITGSGELDKEELSQDSTRIAAFYRNNGYIKVRIGEPEIEFREEGIYITIKIAEGPRFKVGEVDIIGDFVVAKEELIEKIKIKDEEYFNSAVMRKDVLAITDIYFDEGYAYVKVLPGFNENLDELIINVVYEIKKGALVTFERINISGNTKTRDKVIRRELKVYEQELFSGTRLKEGMRKLQRLDYFEDVKVDTPKGSQDDTMILNLDVTEKPTGAFTFGGGFSNEGGFGMASISERNLFGRGQMIGLKFELGQTSTKLDLTFTEPWLFDIPLSGTFRVYKWLNEYDAYDKDGTGFSINFSYPVFQYTRAYTGYLFDISEITTKYDDAPDVIRDMTGDFVTSKISTSLVHNSTDRAFLPTQGSKHGVYLEYAGLGGDIGFAKAKAEAGWFFPLFLKTVGYLHIEGGYVTEVPNYILPTYYRFNLGGINSLRGFEPIYLSPWEINEEGEKAYIGGNSYLQANLEYIFPFFTEGLAGVVFFDTGEVYDKHEKWDLTNLRESAGAGIRWYSPLGPIRIEYGVILDPMEGEDRGRFEFSMGAQF